MGYVMYAVESVTEKGYSIKPPQYKDHKWSTFLINIPRQATKGNNTAIKTILCIWITELGIKYIETFWKLPSVHLNVVSHLKKNTSLKSIYRPQAVQLFLFVCFKAQRYNNMSRMWPCHSSNLYSTAWQASILNTLPCCFGTCQSVRYKE